MELAFFESRVVALSLRVSSEQPALKLPLPLEGWLPSRGTALGDCEAEMAAAGIPIKDNPLVQYPDRVSFVSEAGVSISFDRDGERSRLESFHLLDPEYGRKRAARRIQEIRDTMEGI